MNRERQRELAFRIRCLNGIKAQAKDLCQDFSNLILIETAVDAELRNVRQLMDRESDSFRHPGIRDYHGR